jgi:CRP-like cAMP-binding protein
VKNITERPKLLMNILKRMGEKINEQNLMLEQLANMIGSTRESVTSTLNELVKEDALITGRMSIGIRKDMLPAF